MPSAFESLLRKEVQQFIRDHENDDEQALLLKHKTILGLPASLIATQIADRRKARFKLPTFYQAQNILFPPSVNLEQCSSETTAKYKADEMASIISLIQGKQRGVLDLTGGFGVDTFFFSKAFQPVDYVEPFVDLFEIVKHNHATLGAKNIFHYNTTAEKFLKSTEHRYSLIYIDPSRRKSNQKVFKLADCDPDVVSLLDLIFSKTNNLL
ncbi:MAG: SAM-dependent methyltransferase, partial [Flammeovirgaceae bacterium]|nr:SAM-dependent methyltransferase [Flammeovirgaceae bacterium]